MEGLGLCDACSLHTTITFSPLPNSSNGIPQYQEMDKRAGLNLPVRFLYFVAWKWDVITGYSSAEGE